MACLTPIAMRRCRAGKFNVCSYGRVIDCVARERVWIDYSDGNQLRNVIAPYVEVRSSTGPNTSEGFISDYNDFHGDENSKVARWYNKTTQQTTYYDTISAWHAATGQDAHSISEDPDFVDADGPDNDPETIADNDYHLNSTSDCIDRAMPACPARTGWGGRYDIGCYEYDTRSSGTAGLAYDAAGSLTSDGRVPHLDP